MSNKETVFRSRALSLVPPAVERKASLDVELARATAIAGAGDIVPRAFQRNPGAVLLVDAWASQRGLDLLTAMQGVSIISGKVVVDATLLRALAKRAGYVVKPIAIAETSVTVGVFVGDEKVGEATYTMKQAQLAGLATKDNWKKDPQAMLVARATTRAIRWFASDAATGVLTEDEAFDYDTLDALEPPDVPGEELPPAATDPIVDAVIPVTEETYARLSEFDLTDTERADLMALATAADIHSIKPSELAEDDALWLCEQADAIVAKRADQ